MARSSLRIDEVVVTCEHGGNRIPREFASCFRGAQRLLNSHRGYDIGALSVARAIARRVNVPLIASTTSRLLVDLNRSIHHRQAFSHLTDDLDGHQLDRIITRYYEPYRQRVLDRIRDGVKRGRRVLHLGVHTFTPVFHGQVRAVDVALLYDPKRAAEKMFAARWLDVVRDMEPELRLRKNNPYRGNADGLTTTLRGVLPRSRYLGIELEVNQRYFSGNSSKGKWVRTLIAESFAESIER